MDMQGQRTLGASQQQAWDALNNPEILRACIPGCEKFEPTGDDTYAVTTALKIGPVSARFSGKVQLTDIVPPTSYQLHFDAQGGVAGFGKGQSSVELKPLAQGCELHYTVHSSVGGKIAQLGQRLMDGVAKSLAEDFFKRFEAQLASLYPAPAEAVDSDTSAGTGQQSADGSTPAKAVTAANTSSTKSGLPMWVWVAVAAGIIALVWLGTR